jgi:sarcosine oxidase subunit alpha
MKLMGHVTSSYHSAVMGRSIALAMVSGGRARMGETLYVPMPEGDIAVTVTSPVFYDPEGARVNG